MASSFDTAGLIATQTVTPLIAEVTTTTPSLIAASRRLAVSATLCGLLMLTMPSAADAAANRDCSNEVQSRREASPTPFAFALARLGELPQGEMGLGQPQVLLPLGEGGPGGQPVVLGFQDDGVGAPGRAGGDEEEREQGNARLEAPLGSSRAQLLAALEAIPPTPNEHGTYFYGALEEAIVAFGPKAANAADRRQRQIILFSDGVPTARYYPKPLHQQSAYRAFPVGAGGMKALYDDVKKDLIWLTVPYGKVLIFCPNFLHGNILNVEPTSRWSLNVRFTGLFTPYVSADKGLGSFYLPITPRPVTRIGMSYKAPAGFKE